MKRKGIWLLSITVAALLVLAGCGEEKKKVELKDEPYTKSEVIMGTIVKLKVYDKDKEAALEKGFKRIRELAIKIDINNEFKQESEVDKINAASGIKPVSVDKNIYKLIKRGILYSKETGGSKDITIGPITLLWHIGFPDAKKPTDKEIKGRLPLVGYQNVVLNDKEHSVFLKKKGMKLDLGGIAKGFIADEVQKVFNKEGVQSSIIDLGGNVLIHGNSPSGDVFKVGIQDPFSSRGQLIGYLPAHNKSIVTSGIYERYLEVDGVKYHHLFDPKTGYPFKNNIAGVSIISDKSLTGDGLSSAAFSEGIKNGLAFIEKQKGVEAIFVSKDKKVYITSGLKGKFHLTAKNFHMAK